MPLPSQSLLNDLILWSMSCSLPGPYSATVNLTNQEQQYSGADRYKEFQIELESSLDSTLVDESCFNNTITWIKGVIQSVEDGREISEGSAIFNVRSFFAFMSKKPINTEFFDATADTVIQSLLTNYAGVPASLFDLTGLTSPVAIYASISGNNFLDEVRRVAQASEATVFVDVGGILKVQHWNDNTDDVDVAIPDEFVISAKINQNIEASPSVIMVRGRFVSQFDCGSHVLSSADFNNPSQQGNQPFDKQGFTKVCGNEGIDKGKTKIGVGGKTGDRTDLRNATYEMEGDGEVNYIKVGVAGDVEVTVQPVGGGYLGSGSHNYDIKITGKVKPPNEYRGAGSTHGPLGPNIWRIGQQLGRMPNNLTGLPIADISKLVDFGGSNSDKTSEELEPLRMEVIIGDSDLIDEFGVIVEQIDNLYISDFETLFDVAVRKFQEYKMKRRMWEVNTGYLPCLQLNQVVTFTTPDGINTVTGLLTAIKLDYDAAGPNAGMSLIVESFEDIGSTEYTSPNLFRYPVFCGTNGIDWLATVTGDAFVTHHGGFVQLGFVSSGGTATLWQPFKMEIGASYKLQFNLVKDSGADMVVSVLDSVVHTSQSYSASANNLTIDFIPDEVSNNIQFETIGKWYIISPRLFKTVVR